MKKEIYRKKIKRINGILFALFITMTLLSFSGCGDSSGQEGASGVSTTEESAESRYDTGFEAASYDSFDSADTAIFMRRDAQEQTITLWNTAVGRTYTLSYDGTTRFADKYGESISPAQISPGDVVDVNFLKSQKHLTTMALSSGAWTLEKVTFFELDSELGQATVGQETKKYKLTANTHFFSEGRAIDIMELNPADTLSFQGIDTEILSVRVEKGHGYLRLAGQERFVGGWMEIGQSDIDRKSIYRIEGGLKHEKSGDCTDRGDVRRCVFCFVLSLEYNGSVTNADFKHNGAVCTVRNDSLRFVFHSIQQHA